MQILKTKDYDQFKRVSGNRVVDMNQVNKLVKMNSSINLLWQFPGTVSADNYLIDGQHRLMACKANDWWFYYTQSEQTLAELEKVQGGAPVALQNTAQLKWTIPNFVHFYAERGNKQYQFVEEMAVEHKLSPTMVIEFFRGDPSSQKLKQGRLSIFSTNEERDLLMESFEAAEIIRPYIPNYIFKHSRFLRALRLMLKQISAESLEVALRKDAVPVKYQHETKEYLRMFEEIINHGKQEKNYIRFF